MAVQSIKYCEYFDVNEKYFPCIDESAINNGASWDDTYPHNTFIDLLNLAEKMLGGNTNRSIWIHGAYGTGKSKCAYALKKILDVPEQEVRAYWDKFEPLKKNPVLLEKLIGHKSQGIVTAYRYASGSITTPQQLFFAVQESIKKALDENDLAYKGESSLKESVIAWLEDPIHNQFMNLYLNLSNTNVNAFDALLMHEVGHYINGDMDNQIDDLEIRQERVLQILKGKVAPNELEADRFAVEHCGKNAVMQMLDIVIATRKKRNTADGEIALKELELRKQAVKRM